MAGKRSAKATASLRPKKITARQKSARRINIEVARRYRKKGSGWVSKKGGSTGLGPAFRKGNKKKDVYRRPSKTLSAAKKEFGKLNSLLDKEALKRRKPGPAPRHIQRINLRRFAIMKKYGASNLQ